MGHNVDFSLVHFYYGGVLFLSKTHSSFIGQCDGELK